MALNNRHNASGENGATVNAGETLLDAETVLDGSATVLDGAGTVLDSAHTEFDEGFQPILLAGARTFDANVAAATEGRMAQCAQNCIFTLHSEEVIGSGSQGIVVRASGSDGQTYAAKITFELATSRDRRNRKAVLDYLISLMDSHPLQQNHYKQTHLMPVYAYGKIASAEDAHAQNYNVVIMAYCESNLDKPGGCSYEMLRDTVIPQTATGLRNLHVEGIVHRDIKPKNLYLLNGSVVLGDYGISSLLDAGRDTNATVFDKRTPGYSPHSSVVQRENDWYALGYTIWTLYNGGVHPHQALIDAGDLSAVLAGKRPVEFVPQQPSHASLGELIYGLTLESSRGRLGYESVQEWLENPEAFHFENPFDAPTTPKAYQFNGVAYTNNSQLADAMAASWEDAKDHVFSQTLEQHFKNVGQHDLAVGLHRVVEDANVSADKDLGLSIALTLLKGSTEQFCWLGTWRTRKGAADVFFAGLTKTPDTIYNLVLDSNNERDIYRFLLAIYSGDETKLQEEMVVRTAYTQQDETADTFLKVDKLLVLFELLCENKEVPRSFFINYGCFGNAVWVKQNVAAYNPRNLAAVAACRVIRSTTLPNPACETIEEARQQLKGLDGQVQILLSHCPANPYQRMVGIGERDEVKVTSSDAYQVAEVYGERCTLGFALSLCPRVDRNKLCNFEALRKEAVEAANDAAKAIEDLADSYQKSDTVNGNSKFVHVLLMVGIVLCCLFGWNQFAEMGAAGELVFNVYAPAISEYGIITPDAWWNSVFYEIAPSSVTTGGTGGGVLNSYLISLAVAFLAFTVCAVCVFATRLLQLIPVLFSSVRKNKALDSAKQVCRLTKQLADMPLSESVDKLLANKTLGAAAEVEGAQEALSKTHQPYSEARIGLAKVYRVSLIVLMVAIILASITWAPAASFEITLTSKPTDEYLVVPIVQIIMLATLIYYDYKVVEKSDLLPNMVAVMAAGALFGIVCAINTGMIL